jgi:tetratricopeptide (TPR) repeat protein
MMPDSTPVVRVLTLWMMLAGTALFAAMALYQREAAPVLRRLDVSVGELLMLQGQHAEAADSTSTAINHYQSALAGRFEGPQNRAFAQRRLGMLLFEAGYATQAREPLEKVVQGPYADAAVQSTYGAALLAAQEFETLDSALSNWKAAAKEDGELAEIAYFQARLAEAQGDREAAQEAYSRGTEFDPASRSALELARGDTSRREMLLSELLLHGATGAVAAEARAMLLEAKSETKD